MPRKPKRRLVVLVSDDVYQRYTALAEQYQLSRNEVCRYTLERGFSATAAWCKRMVFDPGNFDLPGSPRSESAPEPAVSPTPADLRAFADVLLSQEPAISVDAFRTHLTTQAVVCGFGSADAHDAVEKIVAASFPTPGASGEGDDLPEFDPGGPSVELD